MNTESWEVALCCGAHAVLLKGAMVHSLVGWVLSACRPLPVILPVLMLHALKQGRGMKGTRLEGGQVGMLGSGFCPLFSQKWMAWSLQQVLV